MLGSAFAPLAHRDLVSLIAFAALGVWLLITSVVYARELAALRRRRRDNALSDGTYGLEEFSVEIAVAERHESIGMDRGVVWFDGALLGFSGEHTSFLIAATDLIYPQGVVIADWDAPYLPLKPKVSEGKVEVTIRPLFGSRGRYHRRMRTFLRARVKTNAERQWPPLEPFDGTVVDGRELPRVKG